jgi:hypothetical protein
VGSAAIFGLKASGGSNVTSEYRRGVASLGRGFFLEGNDLTESDPQPDIFRVCASGSRPGGANLRGGKRTQPAQARVDIDQSTAAQLDCSQIAAPERIVAGCSRHAANRAPSLQRSVFRFMVGQGDTPVSSETRECIYGAGCGPSSTFTSVVIPPSGCQFLRK